MRVLVVEDHEVLGRTIGTRLRREGMAVDVVLDGADAGARPEGGLDIEVSFHVTDESHDDRTSVLQKLDHTKETEMTDTPNIRITDVRTVGVPVTDQDRALEFYIGKLGFETRLDASLGGGRRWIEVGPPGARTTIALVAAGEGNPAGVETGIRFTTADADADHADLLARGVDADDVLRWPGVPAMFAFRDQDGNGLEIVEGS